MLLIVISLNVIMLNIFKLIDILLNFIMLSAIMLIVIMLSVMAPFNERNEMFDPSIDCRLRRRTDFQ